MSAGPDLELPKAQIKRIVSSKLLLAPGSAPFAINKEALLAFSEAAKVFIAYVGATANEICLEAKRSTISEEDVLKAVEELELGDITPQLKEYLETYKKWSKERNQKRAEASKANRKRKSEAAAAGGVAGEGNAAEAEAAAGAEAAAAGADGEEGAPAGDDGMEE